jgi:hypothetical protein
LYDVYRILELAEMRFIAWWYDHLDDQQFTAVGYRAVNVIEYLETAFIIPIVNDVFHFYSFEV